MPTPAERLALLLEVHDDSLRSAADRCGLDHTTLMRVKGGETENPATLAKIAEGYGVPVTWIQGGHDLATDFTLAVMSRPLQERVMFIWDRDRRITYALCFLRAYDPRQFSSDRLSELTRLDQSEVEGIWTEATEPLGKCNVEEFSRATGLPLRWLNTGLIGCEDEEALVASMCKDALSTLARSVGASLTEDEIREAATALASA